MPPPELPVLLLIDTAGCGFEERQEEEGDSRSNEGEAMVCMCVCVREACRVPFHDSLPPDLS